MRRRTLTSTSIRVPAFRDPPRSHATTWTTTNRNDPREQDNLVGKAELARMEAEVKRLLHSLD